VSDLIAFIDGGARGNPGPAGIGVFVTDGTGSVLFQEGLAIGHATNNEAEYRALIHLLEKAATDPQILNSGAKKLRVHCDSKLIVEQVCGRWKIKEPRLKELFDQVQVVKRSVPFELRIKHIPREQNKEADRLVNEALDAAGAV
jgi:ribonuclease H / adenosylcobalamin/alpha-ribazole phosphatase